MSTDLHKYNILIVLLADILKILHTFATDFGAECSQSC